MSVKKQQQQQQQQNRDNSAHNHEFRKLVIASSSLWRRYLQSQWQTIPSFLPHVFYPSPSFTHRTNTTKICATIYYFSPLRHLP